MGGEFERKKEKMRIMIVGGCSGIGDVKLGTAVGQLKAVERKG